jgi:hypothetical protein
MHALLRFFWPVVLLVIFTAVLLREMGLAVVFALHETSQRWRLIKRETHPSIER